MTTGRPRSSEPLSFPRSRLGLVGRGADRV